MYSWSLIQPSWHFGFTFCEKGAGFNHEGWLELGGEERESARAKLLVCLGIWFNTEKNKYQICSFMMLAQSLPLCLGVCALRITIFKLLCLRRDLQASENSLLYLVWQLWSSGNNEYSFLWRAWILTFPVWNLGWITSLNLFTHL